MSVAQMVCEDSPVSYFDYENTTTPRMADTMDCTTDNRVVCEPVTSKKCAEVTYTRCQEVGLSIDDDQHNKAIQKSTILFYTILSHKLHCSFCQIPVTDCSVV